MDAPVIVQDSDPRCLELESDGYRIVGRSWGARLRLADLSDLAPFRNIVARVEATGVVIRELDSSFAQALFDLEQANNADFPVTPATYQPPPVFDSIKELWSMESELSPPAAPASTRRA